MLTAEEVRNKRKAGMTEIYLKYESLIDVALDKYARGTNSTFGIFAKDFIALNAYLEMNGFILEKISIGFAIVTCSIRLLDEEG